MWNFSYEAEGVLNLGMLGGCYAMPSSNFVRIISGVFGEYFGRQYKRGSPDSL
jgi:hypothetical protein